MSLVVFGMGVAPGYGRVLCRGAGHPPQGLKLEPSGSPRASFEPLLPEDAFVAKRVRVGRRVLGHKYRF